MSTKRTTITIPESLYAEAERLMGEQHFTDFSGFVQHLIRAEDERRKNRALQLAEAAAENSVIPQAPKRPVNYRKALGKPKEKIA